MSRYEEMIEAFNEKYDSPEVENITVGYSGIDPQRKSSGSDFLSVNTNHEELSGLMGGERCRTLPPDSRTADDAAELQP